MTTQSFLYKQNDALKVPVDGLTDEAEFLIVAARAVGLKHEGYSSRACDDMYEPRYTEPGLVVPHDTKHPNHLLCDTSGSWNPLLDDGDCQRLAAHLRINTLHLSFLSPESHRVVAGMANWWAPEVAVNDDPAAAMRRAVVLAAVMYQLAFEAQAEKNGGAPRPERSRAEVEQRVRSSKLPASVKKGSAA